MQIRNGGMMGFKVQAKQCATCIYFPISGFNIEELEKQVKDKYMGFRTHRACHHAKKGICCRGFWDRHKDEFQAGQLAQRLNCVEFVRVDVLKQEPKRRKTNNETGKIKAL